MFAFQSFDAYRRTRNMSEDDRKEPLRKGLETAEGLLRQGQKKEAAEAFTKLKDEAKEGIIHVLATQYLAFLKYEEGDLPNVYKLLLSIRANSPMMRSAFCMSSLLNKKIFRLVAEISGNCFQILPAPKLRCAAPMHAPASLRLKRRSVGLRPLNGKGLQILRRL